MTLLGVTLFQLTTYHFCNFPCNIPNITCFFRQLEHYFIGYVEGKNKRYIYLHMHKQYFPI